ISREQAAPWRANGEIQRLPCFSEDGSPLRFAAPEPRAAFSNDLQEVTRKIHPCNCLINRVIVRPGRFAAWSSAIYPRNDEQTLPEPRGQARKVSISRARCEDKG